MVIKSIEMSLPHTTRKSLQTTRKKPKGKRDKNGIAGHVSLCHVKMTGTREYSSSGILSRRSFTPW